MEKNAENYYLSKTFIFDLKNLKQGNVGIGWEGILGKISLKSDGKIVFSRGLELTSTLVALYGGFVSLFKKGNAKGDFFCCGCGVHECTYIHWWLSTKEELIFVKMEDLLGTPIGMHNYLVQKGVFVKAISRLFQTVIKFMKRKKIFKTERVSLRELEKMQKTINSYYPSASK